MDILGFGTPELLLIASLVIAVAVVVYVIKAVRKGIAASKEK